MGVEEEEKEYVPFTGGSVGQGITSNALQEH